MDDTSKQITIYDSISSLIFLSFPPGSPFPRVRSHGDHYCPVQGDGLVVILFAGALLLVIREQRQEANASDSPEIETKTLLCQ